MYCGSGESDDDVLFTLLSQECFGEQFAVSEHTLLQQAIKAQKILWLLDGYDELNLRGHPQAERIFEKLWHSAYAMLTSRPYHYTLTERNIVHLEITGFDAKAIDDYIDKFYAQTAILSNKSDELKQTIKSNFSLQGIAHIPINLELLCSVWTEGGINLINITISRLYRSLVMHLIGRYTKKYPEHSQVETLVELMQCIAYSGMKNKHIILTQDDVDRGFVLLKLPILRKHIILKQVMEIGLMKPLEGGEHFYFLHLSVQEYLAARYLKEQIIKQSQDIEEFIRANKYEPRYQVMWWFLAGELAYPAGAYLISLQHYFNIICDMPITLPSFYQTGLLVHCLNEAEYNADIEQKSSILWHFLTLMYFFIAGSTADNNRPITPAPPHPWIKYLNNIIQSCQQVMYIPEIENMLIEGTVKNCINIEFLEGMHLLSPKVLMQGIQGSRGLTQRFLFGFEPDGTFIKKEMDRYAIKSKKLVWDCLRNTMNYYKYTRMEICSALLLNEKISEEPGIIIFLKNIQHNKILFSKDSRLNAENLSWAASCILSSMKKQIKKRTNNKKMRLLFLMSETEFLLDDSQKELQNHLRDIIIYHKQLDEAYLLRLLLDSKTKEEMLDMMIDILKLQKEIFNVLTVQQTLAELFESTSNPKLAIKMADLLISWRLNISVVFMKLVAIVTKEPDYLKNEIFLEMIVNVTKFGYQHEDIKNTIKNKLLDRKKSFDNTVLIKLMDHLFFALTPREERTGLLKTLTKSKNEIIADMALFYLNEKNSSTATQKLKTHPQKSHKEPQDISNIKKEDVCASFQAYLKSGDSHSLTAFKEIVEKEQLIVYLDKTTFYIYDKKLSSIFNVDEEQHKKLLVDWQKISKEPLFSENSNTIPLGNLSELLDSRKLALKKLIKAKQASRIVSHPQRNNNNNQRQSFQSMGIFSSSQKERKKALEEELIQGQTSPWNNNQPASENEEHLSNFRKNKE